MEPGSASLLDGKVAIVTGASGGIGEAIARALAGAGCRVVVSARRMAVCRAVAESIGGLAVPTDVTDETQVAALMNACESAFGCLDVLVNNAGMVEPWSDIEHMPTDAWDAAFALNVKGVMLCAKHAAPLLKRRGGAIVNVSSRAGLKANARQGAYSATKFAVNGITEAVAQELGPHGVRVNALCPGAVATEAFVDRTGTRAAKEGITIDALLARDFTDKLALGHLTRLDDVCAAAVFLASDRASGITGALIPIDAGRG